MITPAHVTQQDASTCWNCNGDFGFQPFTDALSSKLADHLLPNALRSPKPLPLITALLDQMRAERIIVPAFSTVENLAWEILTRAEATIFGQAIFALVEEKCSAADMGLDTGEVQIHPAEPTLEDVFVALSRAQMAAEKA